MCPPEIWPIHWTVTIITKPNAVAATYVDGGLSSNVNSPIQPPNSKNPVPIVSAISFTQFPIATLDKLKLNPLIGNIIISTVWTPKEHKILLESTVTGSTSEFNKNWK